MANKVRAADVARRAGVSQPTVSRVFTPGGSVSKAVAERVRQAARELGYRPNTLARSLITGRSQTIGLVVAYFNNPFYAEALERLSKALEAAGYHILLVVASNEEGEVERVVDNLIDHRVDGIILASVAVNNRLTHRLAELGLPFVLFNRGQDWAGLASVTADNFEGGFKAAQFLAAGGHKRIAHISGWQKSLNGRERQEGFIAGLAGQGLLPVACIDSEYNRARAIAATHELFQAETPPDAIFVGNDQMAFAVLETLRFELGLDVPNDVSVIGYDDVEMADWPSFDLTTLRQPATKMVSATVEHLLALIQEEAAPRSIQIDSPLIVRGSARLPEGVSRTQRVTKESP